MSFNIKCELDDLEIKEIIQIKQIENIKTNPQLIRLFLKLYRDNGENLKEIAALRTEISILRKQIDSNY